MERNGVLSLLPVAFGVVAIFAFSIVATAEQLDNQEGENYVGIDKGIQPCCNKCGNCTRSIPPYCTCLDEKLACPSWCKDCKMSPKKIYPPLYICQDRIANYCEHKCGLGGGAATSE